MKSGTFFFLILLFIQIPLTQHAQINVEAIPGIRPSSKDINDVKDWIASIDKKLADRDYKFNQIEAEINNLEKKVQRLKANYKRYKKIQTWEEEIIRFREEVAAVRKETELHNLLTDIEQRITKMNNQVTNGSYSFKYIQRDLEAAQGKIDYTKERHSATEKLTSFQNQLNEIKTQVHADLVEKNALEINQKVQSHIATFNSDPSIKNARPLINLSNEFKEQYTTYSNLSAEVKKDSVLAKLNEVNVFYDGLAGKVTSMVSEEVSQNIKSAEEKYLLDPEKQLKGVNKGLELAENTKAYLGTAEFDEKINRLTELKTTIEEYIANDGVAKAQMESRIMNKPVGRFPSEEATIKKLLESRDYGKVVAVSMQDATWSKSLNDFGRPEYKSKWFNAICQKDGKCYLLSGSFRKSYEGNGTYNSGGFFYHPLKGYYPLKEEMNCENIHKRK